MAETQILHAEPDHKKREFRTEFLERRFNTIQAMRPQLKLLVEGLMKLFIEIRERDSDVDLSKLRVEETVLTKDGKMVLTISLMGLLKGVRDDLYYVDDLVGEMFDEDSLWEAVSGEVAQFVSALVNQFAFIKKRNDAFPLEKVTFEDLHMVDGHAVFRVKCNGQPMGVQNAGW